MYQISSAVCACSSRCHTGNVTMITIVTHVTQAGMSRSSIKPTPEYRGDAWRRRHHLVNWTIRCAARSRLSERLYYFQTIFRRFSAGCAHFQGGLRMRWPASPWCVSAAPVASFQGLTDFFACCSANRGVEHPQTPRMMACTVAVPIRAWKFGVSV